MGSRKEEGPGVKCETEIRGMLGSWRERQLMTLTAPPPLEPEPVKEGSKATFARGVFVVLGWVLPC